MDHLSDGEWKTRSLPIGNVGQEGLANGVQLRER